MQALGVGEAAIFDAAVALEGAVAGLDVPTRGVPSETLEGLFQGGGGHGGEQQPLHRLAANGRIWLDGVDRPQGVLFVRVRVVDTALGGAIGADQQVRALGFGLGLLKQFLDVGFAVADADQAGVGAQALDFGGAPVVFQPTVALLVFDGALLGLADVVGIARPDLDVHQSQGHPGGGQGESVVELEPLCSVAAGVDRPQTVR